MSTSDRKTEVEIATGEQWLRAFEAPGPSRASVGRLRRTVRAELGRGSARFSWTPWHGVLAAAASIALAVGVGWDAARQHDVASKPAAALALDPSWPVETWQDAVAMTDLENGLIELEAWSSEEAWNLDGTTLYEVLEDALEETLEAHDEESGESLGRIRETVDPEVV